MCTCITLQVGEAYVGRNMDIEDGFGERVIALPRRLPFSFRLAGQRPRHYAMIGMGAVTDGYPLFADAVNEKGLCMAGLHFPGNAFYPKEPARHGLSLAPFELIPYLLGVCGTVKEVKEVLTGGCVVDIPFSEALPLTPLHWFVADRERALVLESTKEGLLMYENPVGVLTNNPPFPYHLNHLMQYGVLTNQYHMPDTPLRSFCQQPFCFGLGSFGLPGDYSSPSRFVKAAFLRQTSQFPAKAAEEYRVSHVFRILGAVAPPSGSVLTADGACHRTTYSCCMNLQRGIYYYTTYENPTIRSLGLDSIDLEGQERYEISLNR